MQYFNPSMPPSPAPMPVPPLPNHGLFPDMEIDDEMEDDILWDNEELYDDESPIAEC